MPRATDHLAGERRLLAIPRCGRGYAVGERVVRRNGTSRKLAPLACAMCDDGDVAQGAA
jgi:hypothetical protein